MNSVIKYNTKLKAYNLRVDEFNRQVEQYESKVGGRTVIEDDTEYQILSNMYNDLEQFETDLTQAGLELDQERQQLNVTIYHINSEKDNLGSCRREPLGIVKSVEIYW